MFRCRTYFEGPMRALKPIDYAVKQRVFLVSLAHLNDANVLIFFPSVATYLFEISFNCQIFDFDFNLPTTKTCYKRKAIEFEFVSQLSDQENKILCICK